MRTVVNTSEVAHFWANESQEYARNPNNSVFFEDSIIYSYGRHFPMARIFHKGGEKFCLYNRSSYSNTTSGHQSAVRSAWYGHGKLIEVHEIPSYDMSIDHHKGILNSMKNRIHEFERKHANARVYTYEGQIRSQVQDGLDYMRLFQIRSKLPRGLVKFFDNYDMSSIKERGKILAAKLKIENQKKRKERKALEAAMKKKQEERLELWRKHELKGSYYGLQLGPRGVAYLRLNKKGDRIQTSMGAQCLVETAKKLWFVIKKHLGGEGILHPDFIIDNYKVNEIHPNGDLKIGCHNIKFPEIRNIAKELNLI